MTQGGTGFTEYRLGTMALAERLGNVRRACQVRTYALSSFLSAPRVRAYSD